MSASTIPPTSPWPSPGRPAAKRTPRGFQAAATWGEKCPFGLGFLYWMFWLIGCFGWFYNSSLAGREPFSRNEDSNLACLDQFLSCKIRESEGMVWFCQLIFSNGPEISLVLHQALSYLAAADAPFLRTSSKCPFKSMVSLANSHGCLKPPNTKPFQCSILFSTCEAAKKG